MMDNSDMKIGLVTARIARRIVGLLFGTALAGCSLLNGPWSKHEEPAPAAAAAVAEAPKNPPSATHKFQFDPDKDDVVGYVQTTTATADDTLPDIARRFDLGYEEVVRANPGVDPWLPGAGRTVVLPTQFVLPEAPREGIVINVAAMRLYYFPPRKPGELQTVYTHPVGIGKIGWNTPEGQTKVVAKEVDPVWRVPDSVRKEHLENGEELPAVVPPGPDNPLGNRKFTLAWPTYLIHGTNKAYGVGMRSSHGCIRLYPEDIERLFNTVAVGTPFRVVDQPATAGWSGDALYVEVYPSKSQVEEIDIERPVTPDPAQGVEALVNAAARPHAGLIDRGAVHQASQQRTGMPVRVGQRPPAGLAAAR